MENLKMLYLPELNSFINIQIGLRQMVKGKISKGVVRSQLVQFSVENTS